MGSFADTLLNLAQGIDPRPVEPSRERKSVGSETTFPEDLREREAVRTNRATDGDRLRDLAERARPSRAYGDLEAALPRLPDHHAQQQ